jgi:hypothetical protein
VYIDSNVNDDVYFTGCPYSYAKKQARYQEDSTYAAIEDEYLGVLRQPLGQAFGLSAEET